MHLFGFKNSLDNMWKGKQGNELKSGQWKSNAHRHVLVTVVSTVELQDFSYITTCGTKASSREDAPALKDALEWLKSFDSMDGDS